MKKSFPLVAEVMCLLLICSSSGGARAGSVSLRIRNDKSDEKIITRENLIEIKEFILQRAKRETYCQMYNNNPAHQTKGHHFYLNPDSGQQNIHCDLSKSDFNNVTIRIQGLVGKANQYRTVDFLDKHEIRITSDWPTDDLTVSRVRDAVVDAMQEILAEMETRR